MSTLLLAFINLVYGEAIMRLAGEGVRISSAECGVRSHANSLLAATWLKRDHSSLMKS